MPGPKSICVSPPATETILAWLAMVLTPGLGPRRIFRAVRGMREPADILQLPLTALEALQIPLVSARFIAEGKARKAAEQEWQTIAEGGCSLMTFGDADYPERLREIFDPPPVLWVRGDRALLSRPAIAVVGTRAPSPYGTGMAEMLSRDLAARRMVILSGMARGVDTAAHKGALSAGGRTVAVWGTGLDVVYPKENKRLAEDIVMGNVTSRNAWGPNTLIKQGAKLVATWEDVWEELPSQIRLELEGRPASGDRVQDSLFASGDESEAGVTASLLRQGESALPAGPPLSAPEAAVYGVLRMDEAVQIEELLERLEGQVTSAEIFTALFELELNNHIRQLPGKNYVRRM
jgi:DNA processing protein